jgi:hypothetical protein
MRALSGLLIGALVGLLIGIAIPYGWYYYSAWIDPPNAGAKWGVAVMVMLVTAPVFTIIGALRGLVQGLVNRQ